MQGWKFIILLDVIEFTVKWVINVWKDPIVCWSDCVSLGNCLETFGNKTLIWNFPTLHMLEEWWFCSMSSHLLFSCVVKYIGNYGNKSLRTATHMCWSWFIEGLEVMPWIARYGTIWHGVWWLSMRAKYSTSISYLECPWHCGCYILHFVLVVVERCCAAFPSCLILSPEVVTLLPWLGQ